VQDGAIRGARFQNSTRGLKAWFLDRERGPRRAALPRYYPRHVFSSFHSWFVSTNLASAVPIGDHRRGRDGAAQISSVPSWEFLSETRRLSSLTSRFCPQVIVPHGGRWTPRWPAARSNCWRSLTWLLEPSSGRPVPAVEPPIQSAPIRPPAPLLPAQFPVPLPHIFSAQYLPARQERS